MAKRRRLKRVTLRGSLTDSERLTHYESVRGQHDVSTLCGWDGGVVAEYDSDAPVGCASCKAIAAFFGYAPGKV